MTRRINCFVLFSYVRAEVLAGFVNGLFLLFIAFFIFSEAMERIFEPPEVKHERLFLISVLGLLVNLVGIFVFQHGGGHHGHSHGGDDNHSHSGHSDHKANEFSNPLLSQFPSAAVNNHSFENSNHNHSHDHNNHGHSHDNHSHNNHGHSHSEHRHSSGQSQILQGVFLHILADTLGSVGVIISALLMSNFGWMIADPICSLFIAGLVALSVYPLLRDSISVIMQRTPKEIENDLDNCYQRVSPFHGPLFLNSFCSSNRSKHCKEYTVSTTLTSGLSAQTIMSAL